MHFKVTTDNRLGKQSSFGIWLGLIDIVCKLLQTIGDDHNQGAYEKDKIMENRLRIWLRRELFCNWRMIPNGSDFCHLHYALWTIISANGADREGS